MFVENTYEPRFYDYNSSGFLSLEVMLQMLENTALHHTLIAHDTFVSEDAAWVLADWRVEIRNRPKEGQKLHVRTWIQGGSRAASTRNFLVTDDSGNEFFRACGRYALINRKTMRILRIPEELTAAYEPEEETLFPSDAPRLRAPEKVDFVQPIILRRGDIDYNGHVHNTRYIEFALEVLPEDVYRADAFSAFRIIYTSPVEAGTQPEIRRTATDNGWLFSICVGDRVCTVIQLISSLQN